MQVLVTVSVLGPQGVQGPWCSLPLLTYEPSALPVSLVNLTISSVFFQAKPPGSA